jgi:hypothetical protein
MTPNYMDFLSDDEFLRWMAVCDKKKQKSAVLLEEITIRYPRKKLAANNNKLSKAVVLSYIKRNLTSDEFENYKKKPHAIEEKTSSEKVSSGKAPVVTVADKAMKNDPLNFLSDDEFYRWIAVCNKYNKTSYKLLMESTTYYGRTKHKQGNDEIIKDSILKYISEHLTSDEFQEYKKKTYNANSKPVEISEPVVFQDRMNNIGLGTYNEENQKKVDIDIKLENVKKSEIPAGIELLSNKEVKKTKYNSSIKSDNVFLDKENEISAVKLEEINKIISLSKKNYSANVNEKVNEISKLLSLDTKNNVKNDIDNKMLILTKNSMYDDSAFLGNNEIGKKFRFIEKMIGGNMKEESR